MAMFNNQMVLIMGKPVVSKSIHEH